MGRDQMATSGVFACKWRFERIATFAISFDVHSLYIVVVVVVVLVVVATLFSLLLKVRLKPIGNLLNLGLY